MSLTLVFRSDNTSRQGLSVFVETQKSKGEEKLTRPLFAPAQILWKSRHQEKNQIRSQQKQSPPTKKRPCTPTVLLTILLLIKHPGPPGGDTKRSFHTQRNICKKKRGMYKGHLQFYKIANTEKRQPAILCWRGNGSRGRIEKNHAGLVYDK